MQETLTHVWIFLSLILKIRPDLFYNTSTYSNILCCFPQKFNHLLTNSLNNMYLPLSLTALSCLVFTTAGRYSTFNLKYHVTTTRWQNSKALSTLHLIIIFLYLCHFEVLHHKFNTGRGDVMKQHSYSQTNRWMNKLFVVKILLFKNIFLLKTSFHLFLKSVQSTLSTNGHILIIMILLFACFN